MSVYQPVMVVADDGTVISLKYVESMNFIRTDEEQTVDKLRDDCAIDIITISGQRYQISMTMQQDTFGEKYNVPTEPQELRAAIYERWNGLLK